MKNYQYAKEYMIYWEFGEAFGKVANEGKKRHTEDHTDALWY